MSLKHSMLIHLLLALVSSATITYFVVLLFLDFSWSDLKTSHTGFNRWGPSQLVDVGGPAIGMVFMAIITWKGFFEDWKALKSKDGKAGNTQSPASQEDNVK